MMALDSIISESKNEQPILVDIPVYVENQKVSKVRKTIKIPWTMMVIGIMGMVFVFAVIRYVNVLKDKPDLEILAPSDQGKINTPVINSLPTLASTQNATLSDFPITNKTEGFEIKPPSGWAIDQSGKTNSAVVFLNPVTKIIDNRSFATFIEVETRKTERVVLADQVEEIKRGLFEAYPDFVIENDIQVYVQGRSYYLIGGTFFVDKVKMRRRSLITIYKDKGYAISASGPVQTWGDYETVITASMYSFRLL